MAEERVAESRGTISSMTEIDKRALGAIYIYLVAVLFSSSWVVTGAGLTSRLQQLGVAAALAVFWTLYYAVSMHERILAYAREEED